MLTERTVRGLTENCKSVGVLGVWEIEKKHLPFSCNQVNVLMPESF